MGQHFQLGEQPAPLALVPPHLWQRLTSGVIQGQVLLHQYPVQPPPLLSLLIKEAVVISSRRVPVACLSSPSRTMGPLLIVTTLLPVGYSMVPRPGPLLSPKPG